MKRPAMTADEAAARWLGNAVTEENATDFYLAMKREMHISDFAKRTGLPRSEITVVVNHCTKKAFCQWIHAVPRGMETR